MFSLKYLFLRFKCSAALALCYNHLPRVNKGHLFFIILLLLFFVPFWTNSEICESCWIGFLPFYKGLLGSASSPITAVVALRQPIFEGSFRPSPALCRYVKRVLSDLGRSTPPHEVVTVMLRINMFRS